MYFILDSILDLPQLDAMADHMVTKPGLVMYKGGLMQVSRARRL